MVLEIRELPEHSTDAMVTMLHDAMRSTLDQVAEIVQFTTGDVMSAAMHLVIDAGSENVPPAQLREDIIKVVDEMLADAAKKKEAMN